MLLNFDDYVVQRGHRCSGEAARLVQEIPWHVEEEINGWRARKKALKFLNDCKIEVHSIAVA